MKGYDYSLAGAYFITICTRHMACLFGHVNEGEMVLNKAGQMLDRQWLALANRFPNIEFGEYVIMPNHFHAIIIIVVGASLVDAQLDAQPRVSTRDAPTEKGQAQGQPLLGDVIGAFKSITTNEYIRGVKLLGWPPFDKKVWQRNYYEHIIRNEAAYLKISNYIFNNPTNWQDDSYFK